jgi:aspartyl-tRNA(Asn)/glutamyl-tRNA(Gln) amidotransferase subunit C
VITLAEVKKLAALSRLELSDDELEKLRVEIDSIIAYIDTIQKVELPKNPAASPYLEEENVFREDVNPHEPGIYTEKLAKQFPREENGYLKVKKILP